MKNHLFDLAPEVERTLKAPSELCWLTWNNNFLTETENNNQAIGNLQLNVTTSPVPISYYLHLHFFIQGIYLHLGYLQ